MYPCSPGFRTPPKHSGKQLFDHNYLLCERLWRGVGQRRDGATRLVEHGPAKPRAAAIERALAAGVPPAEAAALAAEGTSPPADNNASPGYRQHLARVLVRRALEQATPV